MKHHCLRIASAVVSSLMLAPLALAATTSTSSNTAVSASADEESQLIRTFMRVGAAHATVYDNETISDAEFDFRAYVNHPCFTIVGPIEKKECAVEFGSLANLGALLLGNLLFDALLTPDLSRLEASVKQEIAANPSKRVVAGEANSSRPLTRSEELWEECARRTTTRREQNGCYRAHLRLVFDRSIGVAEYLDMANQ